MSEETEEDRLFREWRDTFDPKHWSKSDLGACRLGWDAGRAAMLAIQRDAERYRYLRERDLETINAGGVFAGLTPENMVINGEDLDRAIDAATSAGREEDGARPS